MKTGNSQFFRLVFPSAWHTAASSYARAAYSKDCMPETVSRATKQLTCAVWSSRYKGKSISSPRVSTLSIAKLGALLLILMLIDIASMMFLWNIYDSSFEFCDSNLQCRKDQCRLLPCPFLNADILTAIFNFCTYPPWWSNDYGAWPLTRRPRVRISAAFRWRQNDRGRCAEI